MTFTDDEKAICTALTHYITLYNMGSEEHIHAIVELSTQVQEILMEKGLI